MRVTVELKQVRIERIEAAAAEKKGKMAKAAERAALLE